MNCYVTTNDKEVVFRGWLKDLPRVGERIGLNPPGGYSDQQIYYRVLTVERQIIMNGPVYAMITVEKEREL